jgi:hypothetical protein
VNQLAVLWHGYGAWRKPKTWTLVLLLALTLLTVAIWPISAAIQLKYFFVDVTARDVTLKWATAAEYDLSGFEVLCKVEGQLDNDYHTVGKVLAEGSAQQGASYQYRISSGLERGVSYCFGLREISIGGEPGEFFERCGYGLDVRPVPTSGFIITDTATLQALYITGTAIALDLEATQESAAEATFQSLLATAAITATPTLTTALQLAPTLTAIALISPTLTAIAQGQFITVTVTPTPDLSNLQPVSITLTAISSDFFATQTAVVALNAGLPVPTITPTPPPTPDQAMIATLTQVANEFAATLTAISVGPAGLAPPTETPTPPGGESPILEPTPTVDPLNPDGFVTDTPAIDPNTGLPIETPTPTETIPGSEELAATETPTETLTDGGAFAPTEPPEGEQAGQLAAAPPEFQVPETPYIVLTATPTTPITPAAPTITPLPAATPTLTGFNLAAIMTPTSENLTLMLLCFTFFAASGLGILGLITSVFYMRSQRKESEDDENQLWS